MFKVSQEWIEEVVLPAAEEQMFGDENPGFCLSCGEEQDGCEPDARNYLCEGCGAREVFGAAEIMMQFALRRERRRDNDER